MDQIKEFSEYLNINADYQANIYGHTDSDGEESANQLLSEQRASAVKDALLKLGVSEDKVKAIGFGENKPIADNKTAEGKFENRRVEAEVIATHGTKKEMQNPGIIEGKVIDALTQNVLAGVSVKVYRDNQLYSFYTTDSEGKYRIKLEAGNYLLKFDRANYILAQMYVNVVHNEVISVSQLSQIEMKYTGTGKSGGVIVNAFNGKGVANLNLVIRQGWDNKLGQIINTVTTDAAGKYTLSLPAGYYTIEAGKYGFSTTYFNIVSVGKHSLLTQNSGITPKINEGEIRIILSWGKYPEDLDAQLKTPEINRRAFTVFYNQQGSRRYAPYADLDLDDRHSFGPETITIYKSYPGIYYYSVQNYSKSPDIKSSNARVQVYGSTGLLKEFHIPSSGNGLYWNVFSYDGKNGQIKSINTISNTAF